MKIVALTVFLMASIVSVSHAVSFVKNGKPEAILYYSEDSPYLKKAVEDLNYHLHAMSGTELRVVRTDSVREIGRASDPAIVIGELAVKAGLEVSKTAAGNSIRITLRGQHLLIAGETPSATSNAIYTFLETLGCDWVMPGKIGEIIPERQTVTVDSMDIEQTPSFIGRNLWYRGGSRINTKEDQADFELWKQRQRMDAPGETPDLGAGHVWEQLIKRHQADFEADPTMLALVREEDGTLVRKGPQIETTNPKIVDLFVQDIEAAFKKNGWKNDKKVAFGIGPADGLGFSLSAESQAAGSGRTDPLSGDPDMTDLCVLLGNQILERIEKQYPNVSLGYYAYSVHGDYPLRYKPHPRLNQIFAPISYSRFHGPLAQNSKTWPYYMKVVEQWGKLAKEQGNQLSYRGYNWNLAENMAPFTKLRIYGTEIPWYHQMGFIAINIEATKAWAVNGPADYVLAKLMWNTDQDWKVLLKTYCEKAFGAGADAMYTYFTELAQRQYEAGEEAGSYHALHLIFDKTFVENAQKTIAQAVGQAQGEEEKVRASYFQYPLEQYALYLDFREAFTRLEFEKAKTLYDDITAAWEKAYAVNTQIVAKEVLQYMKRFFDKFIREGAKYSAAPWEVAIPLPDTLLTQWDSTGAGERLGYPNPKINDKHFLKTRTWSVPWDSQGLGGLREGAIWYRFHFQTPETLGARSLGLFIGGVEDQVDVWLNGEPIGKSPRGFSLPFVFDLTKGLSQKDNGSENVLVLKVTRLSAANEIGLGGIIRPGFLFVGPAVEDNEAPESKGQRVLPGGELAPEN